MAKLDAAHPDGRVSPDRAATQGSELRARYRSEGARFDSFADLNALDERAGEVRGRHYTEWVDELNQLRRDKNDSEAIPLLLECIEAAERAARVSGREPAPAYTERLAIIYERQKRHRDVVDIIERWERACPPERRGPGAAQGRILQRLAKARSALDE